MRIRPSVMLPALLVACAPPASEDCSEPTTTTLAWEEVGSNGASAADVFGFAVGSWSGAFYWEGGVSTEVSLVTRAVAASELRFANPDLCRSGMLDGTIEWGVDTADERLVMSGQTTWPVDVGSGGAPVQFVINEAPSYERLDLTPAADDASLLLAIGMLETGAFFVNLREDWLLDAATRRYCILGSADEASLGCFDSSIEPYNE